MNKDEVSIWQNGQLNNLRQQISQYSKQQLFANQKKLSYKINRYWLHQKQHSHYPFKKQLNALMKQLRTKVRSYENYEKIFPYFARVLRKVNFECPPRRSHSIEKCRNKNASYYASNIEETQKRMNEIQKKVNQQNTNSFLEQVAAQIIIMPSSQCMSCLQCLYQGWKFTMNQFEEYVLLDENVLSKENRNEEQIEMAMCALANRQGGYIFIGIVDGVVEGIKLTQVKIKESINLIRSKYSKLMPKSVENEQIKIDFIPVLADCYPYYGRSCKIYNIFVIRIQVISQYNQLYYILNQRQKQGLHSTYAIYDRKSNNEEIKKMYSQVIYELAFEKYYQLKKVRNKHYGNCCAQALTSLAFEEQEKLDKNEEEDHEKCNKIDALSNFYGKSPLSRFKYQSILLVTQKGEELLQRFKQKLKQSDILFECYAIYQKIPKYNKRTVYYLNHEKKFYALNYILNEMNLLQKPKHLVFLETKPCLKLLKENEFDSALEFLRKAATYFQSSISMYSQRTFKNQTILYFSFNSLTETIFSFTLLEYANIRTNFIGKSHIIGLQPILLSALI